MAWWKRFGRRAATLLLMVLMLLGTAAGEGAGKTVINRINAPDVSADFAFAEDADLLEIIFPQILDCDAAFLRCGGETMLIDCATSGQAQRILNMFKQLGITHVDKIVNTHPHADHIGGFAELIKEITVDELWLCFPAEETVHCANAMKTAERAGVAVRVHLKVDTGMGRIGFTADDDMERAVAEMAEACALPGLVPVGVFTHFAAADSTAPEDIAYTRRQYDILCAAVEEMAARGCTFAVKHCCNSAGTFAWPEFHLDMVRPGIILYGEQPSADTVLPGLVPALRLRAAVSMVKELAAGDAVSYGCTFRAPKPMRAATLAVGYADGYPRALSGRGTVSLHGRPARVLGRVCMDQIVVDVTDIPDVKAGDAAIVFGGGAADSVDDVARMTGTINYEVLCDVGRRVQRVYVENGAEVELVDYLKGE